MFVYAYVDMWCVHASECVCMCVCVPSNVEARKDDTWYNLGLLLWSRVFESNPELTQSY